MENTLAHIRNPTHTQDQWPLMFGAATLLAARPLLMKTQRSI
jgi:hypothetical protein